MLETLNHDKIPNIRNLDNDYMNLSYDPNNRYSIPYFFGTVGILYDKEKYPNETFDSWGDLYHSQLKMIFY